MISLVDVSKRFGDVQAIVDINLVVPAHKTLALIGASGCGKSTLLRLMLGLETAERGEVHFDGKRLCPENVESIRQQVGYVIQEGGLFPHLNAADNIGLLARHLGWSLDERRERVHALATLTHFPEDALTRRPGQLSGGQRQRVALMRALMLDPSVILMDEPLGALDPLIRFELQNELAHIFESLDKTVVIVTHDIAEASFLAHELVLLDAGRIVQRGCIENLRANPASDFVRRFLRAQRQQGESEAM